MLSSQKNVNMIVLTHNYPDEKNSMAGVFVQDHARALTGDREHAFTVLHLPFGEKMSFSISKIPKLILYIMRSHKAIARIDQNKHSELIAHWWLPLGWMAAWRFHGKVTVICHGTDLLVSDRQRFLSFLLRPFARRVNSWQCVSPHLARTLCSIYPFISESEVLVEAMPLSPIFSDKHRERTAGSFISVGALIEDKGHKEAMVWLGQNYPGATLSVVGEIFPAYLAELELLGKELGIGISVRGVVEREILADLFNSHTALLTLSKHEGFGLVCREAKACGLKVIGYIGDGRTDECVDQIIDRD